MLFVCSSMLVRRLNWRGFLYMVEQYLNLYLFLQVILNLMENQEEKDYLIAD